MVSRQLVDTKLTGHRQVTNRLMTGSEIALLDTIFTFYKTDESTHVRFCTCMLYKDWQRSPSG